MKRLLSIVGAVALVAVALIVRGKLNGDSSGSGGIGRPSAKPVIACTPDLQPVCDALADVGKIAKGTESLDLDGVTEPKTLAKLDGWITWDSIPAVANLLVDSSGGQKPFGASTGLGSAPLALAFERGTAGLDGACVAKWECIAKAAADPQGDVILGTGDGSSAESLVRLYPIASVFAPDGFLDLDVSSLKQVIESPPGGPGSATLDALITSPGSSTAVVANAGAVTAALATPGAQGRKLGQAEPKPSTTVSVVVAPVGDADVSKVADAFGTDSDARKALNELGLGPAGKLAPEERAGQLYQVRKKVG